MADKTYYAWSPIRSAKVTDASATPPKVEHSNAQPGDSVTAAKLGLSKEQFDELVASGAVRETKYPDLPEGYQDSPVNFLRQQALAASAEDVDLGVFADASTPQGSPRNPSDVVLGGPSAAAPGL
jgi:hypothetical protein